MDANTLIGIGGVIIGCFVGLAGFFSGRDKKIIGDAEWRGAVNTKLDTIHNDIGGVCSEIRALQTTSNTHGERIKAVEESTASAHKRLDEHIRQGK